MNATLRYCLGCNEQFVTSADAPNCPQCGLALGETLAPAMDSFDQTVDLLATPASPRADLSSHLVGRTIGNYAIAEFIGKGGMAWVFRARHNTLHRDCAIKFLCPTQRGRNEDSVDQFIEEARAAASVVHPNIVTVHNVGSSEEFHFIELEFVPGCSLHQVVQREKRLTPLQAAEFLVQAGSALAAAHNSGLIHRDFKPSNILIAADGRAKLADFGLAKRVLGNTSMPQEGLSGTPNFMAPELFCGGRASEQSDIYAVGVSFFYLLTGRFPFTGRNISELARKHAEEPLPIPTDSFQIPAEIQQFLLTSMAKNPLDRFRDGAEAVNALRRIHSELRDIPSLLDLALAGLDATWKMVDERYEVRVLLPDGRSQTVLIEEHLAEEWKKTLIRIYSICAEAEAGYFERALELNSIIPHGSLAIEEINGKPHFVMLNSYPRSTCDPEELRGSVLDIATWADRVEHALTGSDRH